MYGGLAWTFVIVLILSGLLTMIDKIREKNAQAAENLEKIAQYQGYGGVFLVVFGLINLLRILFSGAMGVLFRVVPVTTIVLLAALICGIILGLLQSVGVLKSWGALDEEKGGKIEGSLGGFKSMLGMVGVISGVYLLLAFITQWRF